MVGQKNFCGEGSAMDDAMCYFFKCFVLTDFFLKKHFERKFIQYLMELTWVGSNHLKVFWRVDALSSWLFGCWCVFINFNFIWTRFLLSPQKEVLDESIRIFIYQTKQTYVKQTWHLLSQFWCPFIVCITSFFYMEPH